MDCRGSEVWSVEWAAGIGECKVGSVEWGLGSLKCGVWSVTSVTCRVCSVKCEAECGVWSGKYSVRVK